MKIIVPVLLVIVIGFLFYAFRLLISRREREKTIAELESLPPAKMDFSTPEGAILCLEDTYPKNDIERAVSCHDFEMRARAWLKEQPYSEDFQKEALPGMAETMEKSYRESHSAGWVPGWDKAKTYFLKREPYGENLIAVHKISVGPDRTLLRQCILTVETPNGWRVVTPLVKTSEGWRVSERITPGA